MVERKRLNLSFSMTSPLQRAAWERLCAIPAGQRTESVCHAICRSYDQDTTLRAVRTAVREAMARRRDSEQDTITEEVCAGDNDEDVLGFLRMLQSGGDET